MKHPGNAAYRKIVGVNKEIYATCLKTEKLRISKSIVAAIREINGRFLEREDGKTSTTLDEKDANGNPVTWKDIGEKRAVEKTSQALREGQPKLLKKIAQRQESAGSYAGMPNNGQFNHLGGVPQTHMHMSMPQQSQLLQPIQHQNSGPLLHHQNSGGLPSLPPHQHQHSGPLQQQPLPQQFNNNQGGDMYGYQIQQPHQMQQNNLNFQQAEQRGSFTAQQLAAVIEGAGSSFSSFPDFNANGGNVPVRDGSRMSFHDSWGSEGPGPLPFGVPPPDAEDRVKRERNNSTRTADSWGEDDPTPLDYNHSSAGAEHVFSARDNDQLLTMLSAEQSSNSSGTAAAKPERQRPSVKWLLDAQRPSMGELSLVSHLSQMSIFSDAVSLDSAMDACERDAEFEMLGEFETSGFDASGMSIGTFEEVSSAGGSRGSSANSGAPKPRRSILRKSHKWSTANAFPSAGLVGNERSDPGLIFTSTMDTKPGGINSGTDISGLLGERRKSVVAFDVDVNRRRSSRMSMLSAMTDISGMFKRDIGSVLSIQSADFREFMNDIDDDSSIEEEEEGNKSS